MKRSAYLVWLFLFLLSVAGGEIQGVSGQNNDERLCPIHHVPLKREKLKVLYGRVANDPCDLDRAQAMEKYFPFANGVLDGGYNILTDPPEYVEVLYCPKCREAEKAWPCVETRETGIVTQLPLRQVMRLPTVS